MTAAPPSPSRPPAPLAPGGAGATPAAAPPRARAADQIVIVGTPNVGKSALFNRLTGRYVTVSNYPGTTVELAHGQAPWLGHGAEVTDTPGMYSLMPISEEERIARHLLFAAPAKAVLHVVDAKNIDRMLGLTLQLAEAGLPVILVLNMMDEARELGIRIDCRRLEELLGVPVVPTVSVTGEGIRELAERIRSLPEPRPLRIDYGAAFETAIAAIAERLTDAPPLTRRTRALLLLQDDLDERDQLLRRQGDQASAAILQALARHRTILGHSPHYQATLAIKAQVTRLVAQTVAYPHRALRGVQARLDWLCTHPLTGYPLLLAVLYFAFYKLVGQFGAGTLVGWLEEDLFEQRLNPWVVRAAETALPWAALRDLVSGEYGIVTLGLRYAVAIVLPVVGIFFIVFSMLEDSGYLPRLAMLGDRTFKKIGLNGRAVIPLVLGFGCDTMATIVTRTLETTRERIIATLLLALAIPCSAQLGLIMALLSSRPAGMAVWLGVITGVFLVVGLLAARLMPGERPSFYMEMPPLRLPRPGNVLIKTYSRMVWYFKEVLPLFVLASVLIWIGQITHIFQLLIAGIAPLVRLLGLPDAAATAFLFGFFRRDYGAAGLYDLQQQGLLTGNQMTVAAITLTLFLPCVAQFLVMRKERGTRMTLLISGGVLAIALACGFAVHRTLTLLGITL